MEKETISITAYGENIDNDFKWAEWYEDAKRIIKSLDNSFEYKTKKI